MLLGAVLLGGLFVGASARVFGGSQPYSRSRCSAAVVLGCAWPLQCAETLLSPSLPSVCSVAPWSSPSRPSTSGCMAAAAVGGSSGSPQQEPQLPPCNAPREVGRI